MKTIEIKLKTHYKSFENNFSTTLQGDLIIISGVNGAGKSQFLNIVAGVGNNNEAISSDVFINGCVIKSNEIDFRSFKENIGIAEIATSSPEIFLWSIKMAWDYYNSSKLNHLSPELKPYKDSPAEAKAILLERFSEEEFNRGIKEEDFRNVFRNSNFIWKQGDRFTNIVGEIFFSHALEVNKKMVELGRQNFRDYMLPEAPWKKLNDLFEKLNFNYRFKDNFEIIGVEISEQPKLFSVNFDNSINENESRLLSDLSDGEKAIIALSFATLIDNKFQHKKLLLLDELDSVLNPSLIEMFYKVLDEFFIKKGIMVILSTHSSTTISLAPNSAMFYEIYKPNELGVRILEIPQDEFSEIKVANKKYYEKIADQEKRIEELVQHINSESKILIITEGKTDWKYFVAALNFFHSKNRYLDISTEYFFHYGSIEEIENSICNTKHILDFGDSKLKTYLHSLVEARKIGEKNKNIRIGIFDSDNNALQVINDREKNVFSFKIEPENISTEFLFKEAEITTELRGKRLFIGDEFEKRSKIHKINSDLTLGGDNSNLNKADKKVIIESDVYNRERENLAHPKEFFARAIYNNEISISDESWENFAHIFEKINSLINNTQLTTS